MKIISRSEARALSLTRYYTGVPCKHGHLAERFTKGNSCTACLLRRNQEYLKKNREKAAEAAKRRSAAWYQNNKERSNKRARDWARENKESERARAKKWRAENPELYRACQQAWRIKNQSRIKAYCGEYRAKKKQAQPAWVCRKTLAEIYLNCPPGYHVDHIIPLKNKNVCGLHVPWNLQYLLPTENQSKKNKFNVDEHIHEFPVAA